MNRRRDLLALTATSLLAGAPAWGSEELWPNRPVRIVLPYPPGGATDRLARLYAAALVRKLGQPVIVDNKPGATGALGSQAALAAPADGYTLLLSFLSTVVLMPLLSKQMPYNRIELVPLTGLVTYDFVLVSGPAARGATLAQLIQAAKGTSTAPSYGTTGTGSAGHLSMEALNIAAGTKLRHVPYKGEQPMMQDLLGGHLDTGVITLTVAEPFLKAGTIKPVALASPQRAARFPDIPTFAELGHPGSSFIAWAGLFTKKGVPDAARSRIAAATAELMQESATRAELQDAGFTPSFRDQETFGKFIDSEFQRYERLVKITGATVD